MTGDEPGREYVPAGLDPAPRPELLTAVERGWPVFPVRPGSKLPAVDKWEARATADAERVRAFLAANPRSNLGVAAGRAGLLIVDCDAKGDPPPEWALPGIVDGSDVLCALAERHGGPSWADVVDTYSVSTPSGGVHYYFSAPAGVELRNSAGKLGWAVDTRAAGGYAVSPGSVVGGRPYAVLHDGDVRPAPGWLVRLLTERPPLPRLDALTRPVGSRAAYAEAALRSEVGRVLDAPTGRRNDSLNTAAYNVGTLVGAGELPRSVAVAALLRAGQHVGLGDIETERTVLSGLSAGVERPRIAS